MLTISRALSQGDPPVGSGVRTLIEGLSGPSLPAGFVDRAVAAWQRSPGDRWLVVTPSDALTFGALAAIPLADLARMAGGAPVRVFDLRGIQRGVQR